jgi:hypothetical protein
VVTLSTGAPLLRQQHFMDAACVMLERERHATVRDAVLLAVRGLEDREGVSDADRKMTIDAVREIATEMALALYEERLNVMGRLIRSGRVEALRGVLEPTIAALKESRGAVAETALRLAGPRTTGFNVTWDVSKATEKVVSEEAFEDRLREHITTRREPAVSAAQMRPWMRQETRSAYERVELGGLERVGAWLTNAGRMLAEAVIQERFPWMIEEHIDRESIQSIRLAVKRYVRDTSFNVAMIVFVFIVFAISVLWPT